MDRREYLFTLAQSGNGERVFDELLSYAAEIYAPDKERKHVVDDAEFRRKFMDAMGEHGVWSGNGEHPHDALCVRIIERLISDPAKFWEQFDHVLPRGD
jgi:hypothetical protein